MSPNRSRLKLKTYKKWQIKSVWLFRPTALKTSHLKIFRLSQMFFQTQWTS